MTYTITVSNGTLNQASTQLNARCFEIYSEQCTEWKVTEQRATDDGRKKRRV